MVNLPTDLLHVAATVTIIRSYTFIFSDAAKVYVKLSKMGFGVLVRIPEEVNPRAPPIIVLTRTMTTIGRRGDIRMDTHAGHELSKIHTTIYRRARDQTETWIIEDGHSVNGTFVNCMKIHRKVLSPGDEVVFGGGPNFKYGEFLISSEKSSCRYRFLLPHPLVTFANDLDPNASLMNHDSDELCPICYQSIVASQTLPCGHTFCLECIHSWVDASKKASRTALCPMCRASFLESQLTPSEAVLREGVLEVWSIEAMLRDLNVTNCKFIRGVNIFKPWTRRHRKWFWRALNHMEQSPHRRVIFLHLTKATISHVLAACQAELQQGLKNFGVKDVGDAPEENRRRMLLCMAGMMDSSA
jgi:hypothetical protein